MNKPVILTRGATFSACGDYRYDLTRRFATGNGLVTFVMLNPSTADAHQEDPTIRRCLGYAHRWGYANVRILNIFALRSTDPKGLRGHVDPVGPLNDEYLQRYCAPKETMRVVAAWGANGVYLERGKNVLFMLRRMWATEGRGLFVLTWTKDGYPGHPLYVKGDLEPEPVYADSPFDKTKFTLPSPEEFARRLDEASERYREVAEQMKKQMELPPMDDPFWTTPFGYELRGVEAQ